MSISIGNEWSGLEKQRPLEDRRSRWITDFHRLQRSGAQLPSPESLDEEAIIAKLWEVIGRLAGKGVFLFHTNHLSDRRLYERLWSDVLHEETPDSYEDATGGYWIIDMVGSGGEDELVDWLRYYASDTERKDWIDELDSGTLPEREDPPYDRDRHLPAPTYITNSSAS